MNKLFFIITICIILTGCARKFYYVTDQRIQELGKPEPYVLDESFELYMRQIVKEKDPLTNISRPVNGTVAAGVELIEIEYLFYSKKHKKALVINNISNRRKTYYNSPDKIMDLSKDAETTLVDIWYFAQFRFAVVENESVFDFHTQDDKQTEQKWVFENKNDTIQIRSISKADDFGEDVRLTEQAFSLPIFFVKCKSFELVFKNNSFKRPSKVISQQFISESKVIYLIENGGKWSTVFSFQNEVYKHYKNILFNYKRMYAPPH